MKSKLIVFASLFLVQTLISQNYQTVEEVNDACSQLGFSGDEDAEIAVDNILAQIGMFRNFIIQECPDINNAIAKNIDVGSGHKERYILYDKEFFTRIEDKAANDWTAISILAHEIGHHLYGHALNDQGSSHKWELEADDFSGFILARMGSTLEDAQSAINTLKYEKATRTHPAKADRLVSIEKGWNRGNVKAIVIPEIKKEDIKEDVIVNDVKKIVNADTEENKLKAQEVFRNHIKAIGKEENINIIKTLFEKISVIQKNSMIGSTTNITEMTHLSPSKYIIEDKRISLLVSGGKMYKKKYKRKKWSWEFYTLNNAVTERISYINELSYIVNNTDAYFSGIKDINGVSCYEVRWPSTSNTKQIDVAVMTFEMQSYSYYNIKTGLLYAIRKKDRTITDYKVNNDYLKNTDVIDETTEYYTDYKEFNNVLFPTKVTSNKKWGDNETSSISEYIEIVINPEIDPNDFKVEK